MRNNKSKNGKPKTGDKGSKNNAFFHSREVESSKDEPKSSDFNHHGDDKCFNDPEWYVNSEQILKDVARVPYSIPVGTTFKREGNLSFTGDTVYVPAAYDNAIPGIMVSKLMPTLGSTEMSGTAGVNIAANSLFQFVRSKISGSRKYEAVDMMIYLGAMDSIFTNITWYTRLYATAYTYHQSNKYLAQALIESQGVDFTSLVNNLPNFRTALNIEIAKIRSMYLPSVLPLFKRHSWMFSHYFIEGDSEKDQIYCHAPAGYHVFGLDSAGKGMLHASAFDQTHSYTWNELITILRTQIEAILRREDFNTISGDMLKAYEGKVFTLTEIPDIATITLTHSTEVLLQFKNGKYKNIPIDSNNPEQWLANFFDYVQNSSSDLQMIGNLATYGTAALRSYMEINPNDNVLTIADTTMHAYAAKCVANEWTKETLLTTPNHDVAPVENMINTRLTIGLKYGTDSQGDLTYEEAVFGSEWPVCYKLFAYHRNKSNNNLTLFSRTYDRVLFGMDKQFASWVNSQEPVRSAFKYLPELSMVEYEQNTQGTAFVAIYEAGRSIFEVDNYALVGYQTLNGLHTAAILGEYNIPNLSIGR